MQRPSPLTVLHIRRRGHLRIVRGHDVRRAIREAPVGIVLPVGHLRVALKFRNINGERGIDVVFNGIGINYDTMVLPFAAVVRAPSPDACVGPVVRVFSLAEAVRVDYNAVFVVVVSGDVFAAI